MLTGLQLSITSSMHCWSQELFPKNAKNAMLAGYYICLPLLVIAATLLACSLAVYLVVPVANSLGMPLNEAGRVKAEATKKLHSALAPYLNADFTWEDICDSGVLDANLADIRLGASQPEAFLERAKQKSEAVTAAGLVTTVVTDDSVSDAVMQEKRRSVGVNDVDVAMDALDFGLFTSRPGIGALIRQSMPVIWIGLVSVWPVLLSAFLRLLWCVPIPMDGEDGKETMTSRLLPSPDTECWSNEHYPTALLALAGLVVWCLGVPLALLLRVGLLADRHSPENYRRYGYFMQGYEEQYWWWDLVVKRADVAIMTVLAYTSILQDMEAKLLVFPVVSAAQVIATAWLKPFANEQAELLDLLEVTLGVARFVLFSSVAAMLILKLEEESVHFVAGSLVVMLIMAYAYLIVHLLAQFLRDASLQQEESPQQGLAKMVRNVKDVVIRLMLPVFQQSEDDKVELCWSFGEDRIAFQSTQRQEVPSEWRLPFLRGAWANLLRFGTSYQHHALLTATEEFDAFLLSQAAWLLSDSLLVLCVLATASKQMPPVVVKSRIKRVWLMGVEALASDSSSATCTPEELTHTVTRLRQMPREDAMSLIDSVVELCVGHRRSKAEADDTVTLKPEAELKAEVPLNRRHSPRCCGAVCYQDMLFDVITALQTVSEVALAV
ncbi:Scube1 [Symbiodinium sp. CCMP2592]|nr:Scube1 [Symbiodinium sp. CCMP2592]